MKWFSTVFFILLFCSFSNAQQRWERTYGGADYDAGYSVQQTSDGGYIVAGETSSFGNGIQVYLIKTNSSGDTLWTKTHDVADVDEGWSVQQTQDGGYIVSGFTSTSVNAVQVFLAKTNSTGDTLWTKTYGGARDDYGWSVRQTQDTGYIVAGMTTSFGSIEQVYLIKTNVTGDTLWTKTYGGTGGDAGNSVQQTTDGGYVIAGYSDYFVNGRQAYLIKTNSSGDTLWTRNFGGTSTEAGYSVQQTTDGGYIIAGYSNSFGDGYQVYLVKTNTSGDTLWTKTYGGAGLDWGYSVQQTTDSGYIVVGYTTSFGNAEQVYLIKTNASGDTLWTRTYGGTSTDEGYSVRQTTDGGYIVAGYTTSFGNGNQVYLIKTDSLGRSTGVEETAGVRGRKIEIRITAIPNPFTTFATLPGHEAERFSLYDISGRRVGTYKGDRIGEGLQAGVYFLRTLEGKAGLARIVKVR